MQVKVIKAINGLEEGDILHYNEKKHKYELIKQDEEISDNGYSSTKTLHSYSKSMLTNLKEYFIFIDKDGNKIDFKEDIKQEDKVLNLPEDYRKLEQKVKDLEQQLDEFKFPIQKWNYKPYEVYYTYNPFKSFFLY